MLNFEQQNPAIELQNVTKHYGKHLAVNNLSFTVGRGEIFGFLGPNGAGKTTTIRLLLGLLHPDSGEVRLLGCSLANERLALPTKAQVGFLPDVARIDGGFSGQEWLQYLAALQTSLPDPAYQKELLNRLQLKPADLKRKISTYSRGMRQKLAIVQALQHSPRLIILDEPTEGLDPLAKHSLFELLNEASRQGATVFFSSHVLSEVERLCERVALIRAGQLVALDSVAALRNQLARRVEVVFASDKRPDAVKFRLQLAQIAASQFVVEDILQGERWLFELRGEPVPLLRLLNTYSVLDITIEPANLEDVFLHFYQST